MTGATRVVVLFSSSVVSCAEGLILSVHCTHLQMDSSVVCVEQSHFLAVYLGNWIGKGCLRGETIEF